MFIAMFIGNLAADAVLQKGNTESYLSFRAASSRRYQDPKTGQPVEVTQWVTVNINRNYERIAQYLTKGTKVFVEGTLGTRIYQDRAGMNQVGVTINASRVELCGSPSQPAAQMQQAAQAPAQQAPAQRPAPQQYVQQVPQQYAQQAPQQAQQMHGGNWQPVGQVAPQAIPSQYTDEFSNMPF